MLLDLWSFAIILRDILEFVIYWAEHETLTVSFGLATLTFFILAYFAWRSTDIPQLVPSPPRPPFIITIQGTTLNNGGRRQSLSDVRVLTASPYAPEITRGSVRATTIDANIEVREASHQVPRESEQSTPAVNQGPVLGLHGTRSLFFGFLRRRASTRPILPTRPLLRSRFSQGPNLVVYHRIYHPGNPTTPSNPSLVAPIGLASDSDSTTRNPDSPNPPETISSQVPFVTSESNGDNPTHSSSLERDESGEGAPVDSCRVLERSYSVSSLRELDFDSEVTTDMDNSDKLGGAQTAQNPVPNTNSPELHDDVKFTLKFLNDTQKEVSTQFNEKIVDFKRRHFSLELSENKIVRLIFNGRVLDNDNKTLRESGIFDQCVVHCLIVAPQPSQQNQSGGSQTPTQRYGARSGPRGPEPGMFFVSFMGIILVFLWFICFNFGQQLFTQSAVVSLSVLTAIFLIGLVAFYLPVHPNNQTAG